MPTVWFLLFGLVALVLALMFYVPALLRPLLGIRRDDQPSIEDLRKGCAWLRGLRRTICLLLTS